MISFNIKKFVLQIKYLQKIVLNDETYLLYINKIIFFVCSLLRKTNVPKCVFCKILPNMNNRISNKSEIICIIIYFLKM